VQKHHVLHQFDKQQASQDQKLACLDCASGRSKRKAFRQFSSRPAASRAGECWHHDNSGRIKLPDLNQRVLGELFSLFGRSEYCSLLVDDYSRYMSVQCISSKDLAREHIKDLLEHSSTQTNHPVKRFYTDGGKEVNNPGMHKYLANKGIIYSITNTSTPQHNAIPERGFQTLFGPVRAVLQRAKLHPVFWPCAVLWVIYSLNRLPSKAHEDQRKFMSRYEVLYKHKPSASMLKVFGCDCCVHILKQERASKVSETARQAIYLCPDPVRENGFRCLTFSPEGKPDIVESRDVTFYEENFTFFRQLLKQGETRPTGLPAYIDKQGVPRQGDESASQESRSLEFRFNASKQQQANEQGEEEELEFFYEESKSNIEATVISVSSSSDIHFQQEAEEPGPSVMEQAQEAASEREARAVQEQARVSLASAAPIASDDAAPYSQVVTLTDDDEQQWERAQHFKDRVVTNINSRGRVSVRPNADDYYYYESEDWSPLEVNAVQTGGNRIALDPQCYGLSSLVQAHLVINGPASYHAAKYFPDVAHWNAAMQVEYEQHQVNQTYELVAYEAGMKVIPSRWVLVKKVDPDSGAHKYKARWVVKGFMQSEGVDFDAAHISASVLGKSSLRLLLALACVCRYAIHQMDAVSAFIQADIDLQHIYCTQPEGFEQYGGSGERLICRLKKAVYGLKQAAYLWFQALRVFVLTQVKHMSWTSCTLDENIFVCMLSSGRVAYLAVYVDDMLLFYHPQDEGDMQGFREQLSQRFQVKHIGKPDAILGMKLHYKQDAGTLELSQAQFIDKVLHKFDMAHCNPDKITWPETGDIEKEQAADKQKVLVDSTMYRSLVGDLLYLAYSTRPDIAHIVGVLSRFQQQPEESHFKAAKRVLRYLAHTKQVALTFDTNAYSVKLDTAAHVIDVQCRHTLDTDTSPGPQLVSYSDADWGRDLSGRRSVYGFVNYFLGCPVSWLSKKQSFVAQSTCEAEYVGLSECVREIRWLSQLCEELRVPIAIPLLLGDNQSSLTIAQACGIDTRIKSVDIKYHYIKDIVQKGQVSVQYVPSQQNIADLFTKPCDKKTFETLSPMLLGHKPIPMLDKQRHTRKRTFQQAMEQAQAVRLIIRSNPFNGQ